MSITMETKFFKCKHCGNIIKMVDDMGVSVVCCGEDMMELKPNSEDASLEKHFPEVYKNGAIINVKVGEDEHPMEDGHHISLIYLETENGGQIKYLIPREDPKASFVVADDKPMSVYAYCNLHGIWETKI